MVIRAYYRNGERNLKDGDGRPRTSLMVRLRDSVYLGTIWAPRNSLEIFCQTKKGEPKNGVQSLQLA